MNERNDHKINASFNTALEMLEDLDTEKLTQFKEHLQFGQYKNLALGSDNTPASTDTNLKAAKLKDTDIELKEFSNHLGSYFIQSTEGYDPIGFADNLLDDAYLIVKKEYDKNILDKNSVFQQDLLQKLLLIYDIYVLQNQANTVAGSDLNEFYQAINTVIELRYDKFRKKILNQHIKYILEADDQVELSKKREKAISIFGKDSIDKRLKETNINFKVVLGVLRDMDLEILTKLEADLKNKKLDPNDERFFPLDNFSNELEVYFGNLKIHHPNDIIAFKEKILIDVYLAAKKEREKTRNDIIFHKDLLVKLDSITNIYQASEIEESLFFLNLKELHEALKTLDNMTFLELEEKLLNQQMQTILKFQGIEKKYNKKKEQTINIFGKNNVEKKLEKLTKSLKTVLEMISNIDLKELDEILENLEQKEKYDPNHKYFSKIVAFSDALQLYLQKLTRENSSQFLRDAIIEDASREENKKLASQKNLLAKLKAIKKVYFLVGEDTEPTYYANLNEFDSALHKAINTNFENTQEKSTEQENSLLIQTKNQDKLIKKSEIEDNFDQEEEQYETMDKNIIKIYFKSLLEILSEIKIEELQKLKELPDESSLDNAAFKKMDHFTDTLRKYFHELSKIKDITTASVHFLTDAYLAMKNDNHVKKNLLEKLATINNLYYVYHYTNVYKNDLMKIGESIKLIINSFNAVEKELLNHHIQYILDPQNTKDEYIQKKQLAIEIFGATAVEYKLNENQMAIETYVRQKKEKMNDVIKSITGNVEEKTSVFEYKIAAIQPLKNKYLLKNKKYEKEELIDDIIKDDKKIESHPKRATLENTFKILTDEKDDKGKEEKDNETVNIAFKPKRNNINKPKNDIAFPIKPNWYEHVNINDINSNDILNQKSTFEKIKCKSYLKILLLKDNDSLNKMAESYAENESFSDEIISQYKTSEENQRSLLKKSLMTNPVFLQYILELPDSEDLKVEFEKYNISSVTQNESNSDNHLIDINKTNKVFSDIKKTAIKKIKNYDPNQKEFDLAKKYQYLYLHYQVDNDTDKDKNKNNDAKLKFLKYYFETLRRADQHHKKRFFGKNLGFSALQKKDASKALARALFDNEDNIDNLNEHSGALTNGRLGRIYGDLIKKGILKTDIRKKNKNNL